MSAVASVHLAPFGKLGLTAVYDCFVPPVRVQGGLVQGEGLRAGGCPIHLAGGLRGSANYNVGFRASDL